MNDAANTNNNGDMAAIFEAMAEFYYALYIIDIKNDTFVPVRGTEATLKVLGGCTSYRQAAKEFIETFVFPDDMDTARRFTSPRYLASVLSPASPYCRIEVREGREPRYEWVAVVFKAVEFDGGEASKAVLAVENVDGMRASLQLDEQTRMQSFARKLNADVERRLRSMSRKTSDERAAMLLKLGAQGRLLYIALQRSAATAFEYDAAADRLSTIVELNGSCETVTYSGGPELVARKYGCSEKDTLAVENAFGLAVDGEDAEVDFRDLRAGGQSFKRMSLYVMRVQDKPTGTVVGVVSDISREKRLAEQARREQEFRLSVLGSSAYGLEIGLESNRWKYLWRNGAADEIRESDDYDKDMLSLLMRDTVAKEDYSAYTAVMNRQSLLQSYGDGREELTLDYRIQEEDGGLRWFRGVIHLLEDGETGETRANVYVSDVDAQKRRELAEAEYKAELAAKAREEKRANELKSRFLTNMSHELRTPLGAMLGITQLALREDLPDQVRSYLQEIRAEGAGLQEILNGILDLARIETGGMEIGDGEYRPRELLGGIVGMFEHQAAEKSLRFEVSLDPALPASLCGDALHLRQVLVNLVSNALKNTEEGGVTVALGLGVQKDGFADVLFSVTDTGVGIRPERLAAMLDEYKNPGGDNAGLGLSICWQLVSLMGGELKADSESGRGSRFYFSLRQRVGDAAPGGEFSREELPLDDGVADWTFSAPDATVLLVDDNFVNLRVGLGLMRPYGMRVITAACGEEALRILQSQQVDLVLMDQMMPDMDGLETTRRLRALGAEYNTLPVLALTANAMKGAREELLAGGMNDYLSKPIGMEELDQKLRLWLPADKLAAPAGAGGGRREPAERVPVIDGVDAAKGLSYVSTFGDYVTCLRDFHSIIPEKADRIEALSQGDDLRAYTSEVHSLKSSARLIGADGLADMAARLEKAGREERTEDIRRDTGRLISLYRAFHDRLEPYAAQPGGSGGFELTAAEYAACLRELRAYVDGYDCDSADHWSEKMRKARAPEGYADSLAELHRLILAAQFSAVGARIDALLAKLEWAGNL